MLEVLASRASVVSNSTAVTSTFMGSIALVILCFTATEKGLYVDYQRDLKLCPLRPSDSENGRSTTFHQTSY